MTQNYKSEAEVDPHPRYDILEKIGAGSFAAVYRALDRELGREVAVKQIHQQFLEDQKQLERYWQEAQLLASLEHPNILTIYDIVRSRGWLIVELMQGNLQELSQGRPMSLESLRFAIGYCLRALKFLHANNIVHGDVKPSNMLVDKRRRTKLGDFGLARRVANDQGSLLKGTTKYMAPEVVSDQFGRVGPASDLYSLGFSGYELLCGSHFETLFPGLSAFGRDKQIAWMMWHSAPDRKLPEIRRVLDGVPDDLAFVIQKLTEKDPNKRYRMADEALADLKLDPLSAQAAAEQGKEERARAERSVKRKRLIAIGAVAASCMISLAVLFVPGSAPPPATAGPMKVLQGEVRNLIDKTLAIKLDQSGEVREISLPAETRVQLNDAEAIHWSELRPGDRVVVRQATRNGRVITEIAVTRPVKHEGRIENISADRDEIEFKVAAGEDKGKTLKLRVSPTAKVLLNGQATFDGAPVTRATLAPNDRVEAEYWEHKEGDRRDVISLAAYRLNRLQATIARVDTSKGELTLAAGDDANSQVLTLPYADRCAVSINDRLELAGKPLDPRDLKIGDSVAIEYDTHIRKLDAHRTFQDEGVLVEVHDESKSLTVTLTGQTEAARFVLDTNAEITLGGESVGLSDLRPGDKVQVTHDSPDGVDPRVARLIATRPASPNRWAVIVGIQEYDDPALRTLKSTKKDAERIHDILLKRAAFSPDQSLLVVDSDASRRAIEQAIQRTVERAGSDGQVLVYFGGHGFMDPQTNDAYLAAKDTNPRQLVNSGVKLRWVMDQLENCPARDKLLLLDATHDGTPPQFGPQPSGQELIDSLKPARARAISKSVTLIASCRRDQRGLIDNEGRGLFAYWLADALSGRADRDRDNQIEPQELFEHIRQPIENFRGQNDQVQSPVRVEPDRSPPRLSNEARQAVRDLLKLLKDAKPDAAEADRLFGVANNAAAGQPEPNLAHALVLIHLSDATRSPRELALTKLGDVLKGQADIPPEYHPLTYEARAWLHIAKGDFEAGVKSLREFVLHLPKPKEPNRLDDDLRSAYERVARLREFAANSPEFRKPAPSEAALDQLDRVIESFGTRASELYTAARESMRDSLQKKADEIRQATKDKAAQLGLERKDLARFVKFDVDVAAKTILSGMDY